jgi:DNA-binding MarR family transcriptional regulator
MRRAFLSICRCGDTLFSPYGVTTDQYALIRAVQREPGIRQADLGSVIFAEPNTVTAMVSLLEKRGILRRRPSPTDKRAKLVQLTSRGEMIMQRLAGDWQPMRQILIDCFSAPGGQEALTLLDQVYEKMRIERDKLMAPTPQTPAEVIGTPIRQKRVRTKALVV